MPIIQINLWLCEHCESKATTMEETFPYSDPVVVDPPGGAWEFMRPAGPGTPELLCCPSCVAKLKA